MADDKIKARRKELKEKLAQYREIGGLLFDALDLLQELQAPLEEELISLRDKKKVIEKAPD